MSLNPIDIGLGQGLLRAAPIVKSSVCAHIIPGAARAMPKAWPAAGHSKIARVRAYYLYCMCLAVLTSLQFLTVTKI